MSGSSSQSFDRDAIVAAIVAERERQDALFGEANKGASPVDFMWPAICAEQVGKAFSVLQYIVRSGTPSAEMIAAYETELIKTAASAVQAIERVQALKEGQPTGLP